MTFATLAASVAAVFKLAAAASSQADICAPDGRYAFAGAAVYDSEGLAAWYKDVFGFHQEAELENEGRPSTYIMRCANLKLEILPHRDFTTAETASERLQSQGFPYGPFKFGLQVAELAPVLARLEENDIAIMVGPIAMDHGQSFVLIRDPAGNVVQFFGAHEADD
ncbi:VOC family protein [Hyphococcus sp.]|uniref:VOC family protein n=1 Tax=Hyphococcus sp. TaxID=2038636 RepID=UPI003CCB7B8A